MDHDYNHNPCGPDALFYGDDEPCHICGYPSTVSCVTCGRPACDEDSTTILRTVVVFRNGPISFVDDRCHECRDAIAATQEIAA